MPFDTEGRPPPGGYAARGSPPSSHSLAEASAITRRTPAIRRRRYDAAGPSGGSRCRWSCLLRDGSEVVERTLGRHDARLAAVEADGGHFGIFSRLPAVVAGSVARRARGWCRGLLSCVPLGLLS